MTGQSSWKNVRACCLAIFAALSLGACAQDEAHTQDADSGSDTDPSAQCASGTEEFPIGENAGLTATDPKSGVQARIVWADHAPPIKERNTWNIAVTNAGGAPEESATISWACAWMPAHLHGTNPQTIDPMGNGRFSLVKQNMAMYGNWQIKLWISTDPAAAPYQAAMGSGSRNADACTPPDPKIGAANILFNVCVPRERSGT